MYHKQTLFFKTFLGTKCHRLPFFPDNFKAPSQSSELHQHPISYLEHLRPLVKEPPFPQPFFPLTCRGTFFIPDNCKNSSTSRTEHFSKQFLDPNSSIDQSLMEQNPNKRQRGEKKPIPEAQKDEKYFERRRRNNQAAKKSRDARKLREDHVGSCNKIVKILELLSILTGCFKGHHFRTRKCTVKGSSYHFKGGSIFVTTAACAGKGAR